MENMIREQQLDLFSDRTSATCFAANQLRLLFAADYGPCRSPNPEHADHLGVSEEERWRTWL